MGGAAPLFLTRKPACGIFAGRSHIFQVRKGVFNNRGQALRGRGLVGGIGAGAAIIGAAAVGISAVGAAGITGALPTLKRVV